MLLSYYLEKQKTAGGYDITLHNNEHAIGLNSTDCYNAAVQFHNHEYRTLGERTNLLLIVQSILVSAFVFVLVGQQSLHYIVPYVLSGIVFVGALFCYLHHESGRKGSRSAFA